MIGTDHDFSQKSKGDKLNPNDDEQDRQQQERPAGNWLFEDEPLVRHNKTDHTSSLTADQAKKPENLEGACGITEQEFDGEKIKDHTGKTEDGVF